LYWLLLFGLSSHAIADPHGLSCGSGLAAASFARRAHAGLRYGPVAFSEHLQQVQSVLRLFGFRERSPVDRPVFVVAWLHDVLEDTAVSVAELGRRFGWPTARSVRVLTLDPSLPRQSALEECVRMMRNDSVALAAKLADRIANVEVCRKAYWRGEDECYEQYQREWVYLRDPLWALARTARTQWMWHHLDAMSR